jgi:hypothetical protein
MIGLEALHEMLVAALMADGAKRADVVLRDHFSGTSMSSTGPHAPVQLYARRGDRR